MTLKGQPWSHQSTWADLVLGCASSNRVPRRAAWTATHHSVSLEVIFIDIV
jgi:hypothetical protein